MIFRMQRASLQRKMSRGRKVLVWATAACVALTCGLLTRMYCSGLARPLLPPSVEWPLPERLAKETAKLRFQVQGGLGACIAGMVSSLELARSLRVPLELWWDEAPAACGASVLSIVQMSHVNGPLVRVRHGDNLRDHFNGDDEELEAAAAGAVAAGGGGRRLLRADQVAGWRAALASSPSASLSVTAASAPTPPDAARWVAALRDVPWEEAVVDRARRLFAMLPQAQLAAPPSAPVSIASDDEEEEGHANDEGSGSPASSSSSPAAGAAPPASDDGGALAALQRLAAQKASSFGGRLPCRGVHVPARVPRLTTATTTTTSTSIRGHTKHAPPPAATTEQQQQEEAAAAAAAGAADVSYLASVWAALDALPVGPFLVVASDDPGVLQAARRKYYGHPGLVPVQMAPGVDTAVGLLALASCRAVVALSPGDELAATAAALAAVPLQVVVPVQAPVAPASAAAPARCSLRPQTNTTTLTTATATTSPDDSAVPVVVSCSLPAADASALAAIERDYTGMLGGGPAAGTVEQLLTIAQGQGTGQGHAAACTINTSGSAPSIDIGGCTHVPAAPGASPAALTACPWPLVATTCAVAA